jgi:hypothetical protein
MSHQNPGCYGVSKISGHSLLPLSELVPIIVQFEREQNERSSTSTYIAVRPWVEETTAYFNIRAFGTDRKADRRVSFIKTRIRWLPSIDQPTPGTSTCTPLATYLQRHHLRSFEQFLDKMLALSAC